MSAERCQAVKQIMKQALTMLQSGSCGQGRGISLATTYLEDAYLRVDFHMREQGWIAAPLQQTLPIATSPQTTAPVTKPPSAKPKSNLAPAGHIPRLNTGLMNNGVDVTPRQSRDAADMNADLDIL